MNNARSEEGEEDGAINGLTAQMHQLFCRHFGWKSASWCGEMFSIPCYTVQDATWRKEFPTLAPERNGEVVYYSVQYMCYSRSPGEGSEFRLGNFCGWMV